MFQSLCPHFHEIALQRFQVNVSTHSILMLNFQFTLCGSSHVLLALVVVFWHYINTQWISLHLVLDDSTLNIYLGGRNYVIVEILEYICTFLFHSKIVRQKKNHKWIFRLHNSISKQNTFYFKFRFFTLLIFN